MLRKCQLWIARLDTGWTYWIHRDTVLLFVFLTATCFLEGQEIAIWGSIGMGALGTHVND